MGVEIRKFDEHVYDGTTGAQTDTVTVYQLGQEIDGVWVSWASKSGDYVDAAVARGKAAQQQSGQTSNQPQGDTGQGLSPAAQGVNQQAQQNQEQAQGEQGQ